MPLGALTNWTTTANGLHQAAQILAGLRMLLLPHEPHYLELTLSVVPEGLSTAKLPTGGEAILDMRRVMLIYKRGATETTIPIVNRTQAQINHDLLTALRGDLLNVFSPSGDEEKLVEEFTEAVRTKYPDLPKSHTQFTGDTPLLIADEIANTFAEAVYAAFTGIARFRARLGGSMTPLVVYPEHFDLSFLWFRDPDQDENKPHLNFGFAPFSEGFPRPYLYAYAYPYPQALKKPGDYPKMPEAAYWNFKPWTGVVVDYDAIAPNADPALYIELMCGEIFVALRPLLDQTLDIHPKSS